MSHHRVTCQQVVELVSDYLDDLLDPALRATVDGHLDVCPGCLEYLSQMRTTTGSLRDLASDDLAPPMVSRLLAAFSEQRVRPVDGDKPDPRRPHGHALG